MNKGRIYFNQSPKPTIGVEAELFTINKDTYELCPGAPLILKEFPELTSYVGIDYIESKSKGITFKIILGKIVFIYPMKKMVEILLMIMPYPFSNYLIRYLLASSIIKGYRTNIQ